MTPLDSVYQKLCAFYNLSVLFLAFFFSLKQKNSALMILCVVNCLHSEISLKVVTAKWKIEHSFFHCYPESRVFACVLGSWKANSSSTIIS